MARISKAEHPRILQMVDSEHRKVAEVAAEYGCTPANIYALLSKLRQQAAPEGEAVSTCEKSADTSSQSGAETHVSPLAGEPPIGPAVPDLFTPGPKLVEAAVRETKADRRRKRPEAETAEVTDVKTPERAPASPMAAVPKPEPEVVASPVGPLRCHTALSAGPREERRRTWCQLGQAGHGAGDAHGRGRGEHDPVPLPRRSALGGQADPASCGVQPRCGVVLHPPVDLASLGQRHGLTERCSQWTGRSELAGGLPAHRAAWAVQLL